VTEKREVSAETWVSFTIEGVIVCLRAATCFGRENLLRPLRGAKVVSAFPVAARFALATG